MSGQPHPHRAANDLTDYAMKRFFPQRSAHQTASFCNIAHPRLCALLAAPILFLLSTSCIYEAPGDHFYRTLWKASDEFLGETAIEFLCGNKIRLQSSRTTLIAFSSYRAEDNHAVFENLTITIDGTAIIIDQAYRGSDGEHLTLIWHDNTSRSTQETTFHRLSTYE